MIHERRLTSRASLTQTEVCLLWLTDYQTYPYIEARVAVRLSQTPFFLLNGIWPALPSLMKILPLLIDACAGVDASAHMYRSMCLWRSEDSVRYLPQEHCLHRIHYWPKLTDWLDWLTSELQESCFHLPNTGVTKAHHHTQHFYVCVLGIKLESSWI